MAVKQIKGIYYGVGEPAQISVEDSKYPFNCQITNIDNGTIHDDAPSTLKNIYTVSAIKNNSYKKIIEFKFPEQLSQNCILEFVANVRGCQDDTLSKASVEISINNTLIEEIVSNDSTRISKNIVINKKDANNDFIRITLYAESPSDTYQSGASINAILVSDSELAVKPQLIKEVYLGTDLIPIELPSGVLYTESDGPLNNSYYLEGEYRNPNDQTIDFNFYNENFSDDTELLLQFTLYTSNDSMANTIAGCSVYVKNQYPYIFSMGSDDQHSIKSATFILKYSKYKNKTMRITLSTNYGNAGPVASPPKAYLDIKIKDPKLCTRAMPQKIDLSYIGI